MNSRDVGNLAEWIYDLRPHVKAYKDQPDLLIELAAASLMHRLRRMHPELHKDSEEEFWAIVRFGPWEPDYREN